MYMDDEMIINTKGKNIPSIVPDTEPMIDQYFVLSALDRSFSCDKRTADENCTKAVRSLFTVLLKLFIRF